MSHVGPNDDTQVSDLSPVAKSLRASFDAVAVAPSSTSPAKKPAKHLNDLEPSQATLPAKLPEPGDATLVHFPEPAQKDDAKPTASLEAKPVEALADADCSGEEEDLFHAEATEFLTREAQFVQKAEAEKAKKGKPKAAAKPKAKAKSTAKAKATSKAKAVPKAKGKVKKRPAASKSWEERSEGEASESEAANDDGDPGEEGAEPTAVENQKSKAKLASSKSRKAKDKRDGKEKKSFARRFRPMKDVFAGQKWDCLKQAFFVHINEHVRMASKVEAGPAYPLAP